MKALRLFALAIITFAVSAPAFALTDARARRYATAAEFTSATNLPQGTIAHALDTDVSYLWNGTTWVPMPKTYSTNALLRANSTDPEGTVAYAVDTNTSYLRSGSTWVPMDPRTPEYTITFDGGASKEVQTFQSDYTAFDSTAGTLNYIHYAGYMLGAMQIVDAGNSVPVVDAEGLDITAGNVTENDHVSYFAGVPGTFTTGRPMVVGRDEAFKFCATVKFHDVTGSDAFYCGWRDSVHTTAAIASYTEYCSIGHVGGNIGTHDKANGADDCGSDTWADDATKTICTLVSAAGVCTYTVNGTAPSSPGAETIADGTLVVPFCQLLHDADGADDTWITSWSVAYQ